MRSYVNNLGGLKTILELPTRMASRRILAYNEESILVGNLEELVNLSIQEIVQPLDQLGLDSLVFQSPLQSLFQSPPQTLRRIMAGKMYPQILINPIHHQLGELEHNSTWLLICMLFLRMMKRNYLSLTPKKEFMWMITCKVFIWI